MDLKLIQRLVALMRRGELSELEVDDSQTGVRVRLRRGAEAPLASAPVVHVTQGAAPALSAAGNAAAVALPVPAETPVGKPFTSPMVGTFYRSSAPDSDPFVRVGSRIEPESVLCIIEAMKVMNEIKAEMSGEVLEVLVDNGEPVEFGQPLFLIGE